MSITIKAKVTKAIIRHLADGTPELQATANMASESTPLVIVYQYPSSSHPSQAAAAAMARVLPGKTLTAYVSAVAVHRHGKQMAVKATAMQITVDGVYHHADPIV